MFCVSWSQLQTADVRTIILKSAIFSQLKDLLCSAAESRVELHTITRQRVKCQQQTCVIRCSEALKTPATIIGWCKRWRSDGDQTMNPLFLSWVLNQAQNNLKVSSSFTQLLLRAICPRWRLAWSHLITSLTLHSFLWLVMLLLSC